MTDDGTLMSLSPVRARATVTLAVGAALSLTVTVVLLPSATVVAAGVMMIDRRSGARAGWHSGSRWGWGSGVTPPVVQVTLLRVNAVGLVLVPVHRPLKPTVVDAPVPRVPFHDRLVALTLAPDAAQVADQPGGVNVCPAGKANRSVQLVSGSPVFLTTTLAVKPPELGPSVQSLVL